MGQQQPKQRERCDCNVGCLKATGNLNEKNHMCMKEMTIVCVPVSGERFLVNKYRKGEAVHA